MKFTAQLIGNLPPTPEQIAAMGAIFQRDYEYANAHAEEVSTAVLPECMRPSAPLISALGARHGLRLQDQGDRRPGAGRPEIVWCQSVDQHQDNIHGLVLFWILHNDAMLFRQKGMHCVPAVGDVILFNDHLSHGVDLPNGKTWDQMHAQAYFGGVSWPAEYATKTTGS